MPRSWTPAKLSANGLFWLRADGYSSGNIVDRYGNFTFSQGTAIEQPTLGTGSNGRPYMDFDGVNTFGDNVPAAETFGSNLTSYTAWFVIDLDAIKSHTGLLSVDTTPASLDASQDFEIYLSAGTITAYHNRNIGPAQSQTTTITGSFITTGTVHLIVYTWEVGHNPRLIVDGTERVAKTVHAGFQTLNISGRYPCIGTGYDASSGFVNGKIYEAGMLTSEANDTQLNKLLAYKLSRY